MVAPLAAIPTEILRCCFPLLATRCPASQTT